MNRTRIADVLPTSVQSTKKIVSAAAGCSATFLICLRAGHRLSRSDLEPEGHGLNLLIHRSVIWIIPSSVIDAKDAAVGQLHGLGIIACPPYPQIVPCFACIRCPVDSGRGQVQGDCFTNGEHLRKSTVEKRSRTA